MTGLATDIFGNIARLGGSPRGMEGLAALLAGLQGERQADWDAMEQIIGFQNQAQAANQELNDILQAGDRSRAAADMEMGQIAEGLGGLISEALAGRGEAIAEPARGAAAAMRGARAAESGDIRSGGGSAFERAKGARTRAAGMRTDARRGFDRSREVAGERDYRMGRAAADTAYRMGRADDRGRAGMMEAGIRARPKGLASQIAQWQAGQVRPEYSPVQDVATTFAPGLVRQGLQKSRARERSRNEFMRGQGYG